MCVCVLAESKGQIHMCVPNVSEFSICMRVTSRRCQVMFPLRHTDGQTLVVAVRWTNQTDKQQQVLFRQKNDTLAKASCNQWTPLL